MQFAAEPYVYDHLPTGSSIRLVAIAKKRITAPVESGTPLIECFVRTVDLDDLPAYKALSYTWGNPNGGPRPNPAKDKYSPLHLWPISLNGRLFKVRLSLFEVLSYISSSTTPNFAALDIDERTHGFKKSRLIRMAEEGRLQDVKECLEHGANINMQDIFGETALHYAAENGHLDVVKLLLGYGARTDTLDKTQRTPLACCLQRERGQWKDVAEVLVDPQYLRQREETIEILGPALWIDGICIDQTNIQERNAQVALMARIYNVAVSTRVWLGPEKEDTYILQQILSGNPTDIETRQISPQEIKAMGDVLRRAWFKRKWVIQEFCLAGSVEIYCGRLVLGTNVAAFMALMANPAIRKAQTEGDVNWTTLFDLRAWIIRERAWKLNRIHLATLIGLTWGFATEDPRDAIFALLGLMPKITGGKNIHGVIPANYSRSTADVFTEAASIVIQARGDRERLGINIQPLEALSWIKPARREVVERRATKPHLGRGPVQDMPGWVPNFHMAKNGAAIWATRFLACGKRKTSRFWPSEPNFLKVSGRYLDQVVQVPETTVEFTGTGTAYNIGVDVATWLDMITPLNANYHGICGRVEALWRCLMLDYVEHTDVQTAKTAFKRFICAHSVDHDDPARIKDLVSRLRPNDVSSSLPSDEELEGYAYTECPGPRCASPEVCIHRLTCQAADAKPFKTHIMYDELFRTENGYLGLGPSSIREGDQVWILDGGRVPFVLRPLSSGTDCPRYRFLGESYVHGVMYGDVMNRRPFSKVDSYTIELE